MKYTKIVKMIGLFLLLMLDYSYAGDETMLFYLFSHGIADTHRQSHRYIKNPLIPEKNYIIDGPVITFDYPDATTSKLRINRHQASLGQDNEIVHLANNYFANISPEHKVVLVGVSRGAAILLHFMNLYNPQAVQALVLESPFDSMHSIVRSMIYKSGLSWIPGSERLGLAAVCCIFKKHKSNGIRPIDSACSMRTDIPIIFVCSLEDPLVPAWSTMLLYAAVRSAGNQDAYLLVLPKGKHAKIILSSDQGSIYQQVVHAFYQKYNLPHDPNLALLGTPILKECQPKIEDLASHFPSYAHEKIAYIKGKSTIL